MGFFDNNSYFRKAGQKAMGTVEAASHVADAVQSTRTAFGKMSDENLPYANMMGNPQGARGRESMFRGFDDDPEDEENGGGYSQEAIVVTENLRNTFRQKAKLKVDIISGRIKSRAILKKLAAKLLIQNQGDEEIANRYKGFEPDQIKELDKDTQKIIRNQKHIKAIDSIELPQELKEQCIEYFAIEFEDEYVENNGKMPDFSQFNPMELMFQNFDAPYKELLGDLVLDIGMDLKPKATDFLSSLFNKYVKKKVDEIEQPEQVIEQAPVNNDIPQNDVNTEQPSAVVVEEPAVEEVVEISNNILQLPRPQPQRWASTFKINGLEPDSTTPHFEDFLASRGLDMDDLSWGNDKVLFPDVSDRLRFLNDFDKFSEAREKSLLNNAIEDIENIDEEEKSDGDSDLEEHEEE